jgi:N utilization substance protein A
MFPLFLFLPADFGLAKEGGDGVVKSDFLLAVTQLATERRLPTEVVLSAIEAALVSAFKGGGRDAVSEADNVTVRILPTTGEIRVFVGKIVVEDVEDSNSEMTLDEARAIRADAELGETVEIEETPADAGRIAAQTAKQVVMQRLREAERDVVFEEYVGHVNELLPGVVQKLEPGQVIINLGRTEAVLPADQLVPSEHYRPGQRLRVLVREVERGQRGPQIIVSRAHKDLIRRLFELEVPEIANGIVVIRGIAREPGYRTKVSVEARQAGVDPVGSCVGLRGVRIQNIVNELHGEKIDVVPWNADSRAFIAQALSPAQVTRVEIIEEKSALVVVPDQQLSLAIGREGQNARLAAKLTGWRIDIRSNSEVLAQEGDRTARGPEQAVELAAAAVATAILESEQAGAPLDFEPAATLVTTPPPAVEPAPAAVAPSPAVAPETVVEPVAAEAGVTEEQPAAMVEESTKTTAVETTAEIEAALKVLAEEEAAEEARLRIDVAEDGPEEEGEAEQFDFDAFFQQYQQKQQGEDGQIRFAEDIFPERGRRAPGNDRGGRRAGGGRRR